MNIGAIQNSQQSFSSLSIHVKDTGDSYRKEQLETLKNEIPCLKQMPEVDKYAIRIYGVFDNDELLETVHIKVKRPGLFNTKSAVVEWLKGSSIQDSIRNAVDYLHEKESRKDNGINFSC